MKELHPQVQADANNSNNLEAFKRIQIASSFEDTSLMACAMGSGQQAAFRSWGIGNYVSPRRNDSGRKV
eukprot:6113437-Amphidinium_carterae.1